MAALRKQNMIILILLAVILVQFIALAAVLVSKDRSTTADKASTPQGTSVQAEKDNIPDPLQTTDETPQTPEFPMETEPPVNTLTAEEILSSAQFIAHGMGEIDGIIALNCKEAFLTHYEKGVRVFEVDLRLTSDMQVVLRHDWRAKWQDGVSEWSIPTLKDFLKKPYLGEYTPMSFQDLLLLMEEYPDICIITDSKFIDAEIVTTQFEAMLRDAENLGLSHLFDRMVIQVYNKLMFKVVDNIHHFPNYIYTVYLEGLKPTETAFRELAEFCRTSGISGITMGDVLWRDEFAPLAEEYGLRVYTHTINDPAAARAMLDAGVSAIYTDQLGPQDLDGAMIENEGA